MHAFMRMQISFWRQRFLAYITLMRSYAVVPVHVDIITILVAEYGWTQFAHVFSLSRIVRHHMLVQISFHLKTFSAFITKEIKRTMMNVLMLLQIIQINETTPTFIASILELLRESYSVMRQTVVLVAKLAVWILYVMRHFVFDVGFSAFVTAVVPSCAANFSIVSFKILLLNIWWCYNIYTLIYILVFDVWWYEPGNMILLLEKQKYCNKFKFGANLIGTSFQPQN